jgi:hypothetical protein
MKTATVNKLEYILSGTNVTMQERDEIIDLMQEYASQSVPPTPDGDELSNKEVKEMCDSFSTPVTDKPFNEEMLSKLMFNAYDVRRSEQAIAEALNEKAIEWAANKDNWISVEDDLPIENKPFHDSDYVLCRDENKDNIPFVAWYNHKENKWTVANYLASSISIAVTHWQPLPNKPIK